MWMFTKFGMFSCVCGKKGGGKKAGTDKSVIMIRARLEEHLIRLVEAIKILAPFEIKESPSNDYRYRIVIPAGLFPEVMVAVAKGIDYNNFKSEVFSREGASDYERALHKVWGVMYGVQVAETGPGIYSAPATSATHVPTEFDSLRDPDEPFSEPEEADAASERGDRDEDGASPARLA